MSRQGFSTTSAVRAGGGSACKILADREAKEIAAAIEQWFPGAARDLPWRRRRNGYAALVSECMLQQTQVSRVVEAFTRFIRRFPTVEALAAADEDEVLAAWQGLGYYRRARNLHRAAAIVRDQFRGRVPRTANDLLSLPGVGRYTAGAIASLVFGERAAIVDGNISRVVLRVMGCSRPAEATATQKMVWSAAEALVRHARDPAIVNEGLMELGALVCTPGAPKCEACPLRSRCTARRRGLVERIPSPRRPPAQAIVHHHAVVVRRGRLVLLEQRGDRGLWARMWQTPTIESDHPLAPRQVERALAIRVRGLTPEWTFEHRTTHRRITFHVFTAHSRAKIGNWLTPVGLRELALSTPQRRILREFTR